MNKKILLLIIVLIFVILILILWRMNANRANQSQLNPSAPKKSTAQFIKRSGGVILSTLNNASTASLSAPLTLKISASSSDKVIVGYDILIAYDPAMFSLIGTQSQLSQFRIFPLSSVGLLTVTGVKDPTSQTALKFESTELAQVTFQPRKAGEGTFTILPSQGVQKTQLVDNHSQKLFPQTSSITISVK